MQIHVFSESMPVPQLSTAVVPAVTYGELHLGSSWVPICLCNLSDHSVKNPHKNSGWPGCACQPSTTSGPSDSEVRGVLSATPKNGGSCRPWASKTWGNGPKWSKNRPGSCSLNGNTSLPTATWTWVEPPSLNIKLR